MRARSGTRRGAAALAGAVSLLLLVSAYLFRSAVDTSPVAPPQDQADASRPDATDLVTGLDKKTAEQFPETAGRPLFNPNRRPVQRKEITAAEPKAELITEFRLVGVLKLPNRPPRALIRSASERTGKWIAEGAEFDGWKLRKVNDRSVVIKSGKRAQELTLATPRNRSEEPNGSKR